MFDGGMGKALLLIALMAGCVLFGIGLATQGTERIHGSLTETRAAAAPAPAPNSLVIQAATAPAPAPAQSTSAAAQGASQLTLAEGDPGINRLGNKIGELLQIMAHHCIQLFTKLLDSLLG